MLKFGTHLCFMLFLGLLTKKLILAKIWSFFGQNPVKCISPTKIGLESWNSLKTCKFQFFCMVTFFCTFSVIVAKFQLSRSIFVGDSFDVNMEKIIFKGHWYNIVIISKCNFWPILGFPGIPRAWNKNSKIHFQT